MDDPYRTPPDPWDNLHACTQDAPSCGVVSPNVMLAELLQQQAALQHKLLRLGRVAVVAAVVLSATPWVLIGLGPWPQPLAAQHEDTCEQLDGLGEKSCANGVKFRQDSYCHGKAHAFARVATNGSVGAAAPALGWGPAPLELPPPSFDEPILTPRTLPASQVNHAWMGSDENASTAFVRATARANEALLAAFERPEVTVQRVVMSEREAARLFTSSDLRTRIQPVAIKGGYGLKLLRLPKGNGLERLGIEQGDLLVRVNGRRLSHPDMALEAYADAQRAKHAVIELVREGRAHVISVTWDG